MSLFVLFAYFLRLQLLEFVGQIRRGAIPREILVAGIAALLGYATGRSTRSSMTAGPLLTVVAFYVGIIGNSLPSRLNSQVVEQEAMMPFHVRYDVRIIITQFLGVYA